MQKYTTLLNEAKLYPPNWENYVQNTEINNMCDVTVPRSIYCTNFYPDIKQQWLSGQSACQDVECLCNDKNIILEFNPPPLLSFFVITAHDL